MNNTSTPTSKKSRTSAMIWGNLLALSAAICWGLNEPANKAIIPDWISASGVALGRIFGATVIIWIISLFVKKEKIQHGDWKLLWASALMMLGFVYVFSLAFNTASPIDIAIILTFQPILVVIINAIFKHEHVSVLEIVGMVIALGGALLVILGGGNFDSGRLVGDLFAVVCAVTYAIYLVIIEGPSQRYGTVSLMKWVFLFTAILSSPLIFSISPNMPIFTHGKAMPWLLLGFIILFPTVYCYLVTPPAIKLVGSDVLAFYQYLVPVITTVVAIAAKMDSFHWYQPVSFVIIVAGVILVNYAKAKQTKSSGVSQK
ncbi:MAG: DMT family transporter [Muribaculaceae bacterium]|nr:DMT family transporter [Muribaculaceae bacterium]